MRSPRLWIACFLLLLTVALAASLLLATVYPMDDHFLYQRFVESLAGGTLDLTIPGFHGSDVLAVPIVWITGSPIAQIILQILCAMLLPACSYFAAKAIFGRSEEAVLFAATITLMPFLSFVALRGWTGPAYFCLLFTAIIVAKPAPVLGGVFWALALLTKPFALGLAPLFIHWTRESHSPRRRFLFLIPLLLVGAYVALQYAQAGRIIVGAHPNLSAGSAVQGPVRILLNIAHALQILFSVHNFYPLDPARTGAGNLMHTTPVFVFLALFTLFSRRVTELPPSLKKTLGIGALIALLMNVPLDHMDHFYMETGVVLLILTALPLLLRERLWIALALVTLHFQWIYFFLDYRTAFALGPWFFLVPAFVDILALLFFIVRPRAAFVP